MLLPMVDVETEAQRAKPPYARFNPVPTRLHLTLSLSFFIRRAELWSLTLGTCGGGHLLAFLVGK
jgi:hypothetical protein